MGTLRPQWRPSSLPQDGAFRSVLLVTTTYDIALRHLCFQMFFHKSKSSATLTHELASSNNLSIKRAAQIGSLIHESVTSFLPFRATLYYSIHQRNCAPRTPSLRCTKNQALCTKRLIFTFADSYHYPVAVIKSSKFYMYTTLGTRGLIITS